MSRKITLTALAAGLLLVGALPVRAGTWPFPDPPGMRTNPVIYQWVTPGGAGMAMRVVVSKSADVTVESYVAGTTDGGMTVTGSQFYGPGGSGGAAFGGIGDDWHVQVTASSRPMIDYVEAQQFRYEEGTGVGLRLAPGTWYLAEWVTSNSPISSAGFRIGAGTGVRIAKVTKTTTTFLQTDHHFPGTNVSVTTPGGIGGAGVGLEQSWTRSVSNGLMGMYTPPWSSSPTVGLMSYTGPGSRSGSTSGPTSLGLMPAPLPAGTYTFREQLAATAGLFYLPGFVAGADLQTP